MNRIRDWQSVPHDPLAEAIVVNAFFFVPDRISQYPEVGPLLWKQSHRTLWRAMERVAREHGPLGPDRFAIVLRASLEAYEPKRWRGLWRVTSRTAEDRIEWAIAQAQEHGGVPDDHYHNFTWWLDRLAQFHEARELVSKAQLVAERAWRGDVQGARRALNRNVPERVPVSLKDSIVEF